MRMAMLEMMCKATTVRISFNSGALKDLTVNLLALDYAYRYYAFLESHPAHVPLPSGAYHEALDALTWSYSEWLLKSQSQPPTHHDQAGAKSASNRGSKAPPPFKMQEAQELINILKSTNSGEDEVTRSTARTRVVARVLRRMVQWKQHFFRPEKPLPHGTSQMPTSHPSHHHHTLNDNRSTRNTGGFGRTTLDVVLAWVCLGVPYLYANRHAYWYGSGYGRYGMFDEEGGFMRSFGPMLVVGVGVCVVVRASSFFSSNHGHILTYDFRPLSSF